MLIFETFLQYWHIILLFFIVAILYSSVGFGGGSSYLAILALTGIVFTQIRTTALLCNIVVVSSNVFLFFQQKKIDFKKTIPLILFSIPLAFLGGMVQIAIVFYFIRLYFILCRNYHVVFKTNCSF
jgi:uncharacterized membrane protein YfcA